MKEANTDGGEGLMGGRRGEAGGGINSQWSSHPVPSSSYLYRLTSLLEGGCWGGVGVGV